MKNFSQILLPLVFCISLPVHGITYYGALTTCLDSRNDLINAIGTNLSTKYLEDLNQENLDQTLMDFRKAYDSDPTPNEEEIVAVCFLAGKIREQLIISMDAQTAQRLAEEEEEEKKDALLPRWLTHEDDAPGFVGQVFKALGSMGSALFGAGEHSNGGASAGPSESPKASGHARRSPAPADDESIEVVSYLEVSKKLPFPKGCLVKWLPCLEQKTNQCGFFSALYAFLAFLHSADADADIKDLENALTSTSTKECLEHLLDKFSDFCDPKSGTMNLLPSDQVELVVESLLETSFAKASSEHVHLGLINGKTNMQPAHRALLTILKLKILIERYGRENGSIISNILSRYKEIKPGSYDRRTCIVHSEGEIEITLQDLDDIAHDLTPGYFSLLSAYHSRKTVILLTLIESERSSVNHWLVYVLKKGAPILVIDSLNPRGVPNGACQEVLNFLEDAHLTRNDFFDEDQQILTQAITK